jgi:hypothetical protein
VELRLVRAEALGGVLTDASVAALTTRSDSETDSKEKARQTARLAWLHGDRVAGLGRWANAFAFYHQVSTALTEDALVSSRDDAWARAGGTAAGLATILAQTKGEVGDCRRRW